ncbi:MAG: DUF2339 domain-containing protein [Eudoraea sp.]|nr:DUF2339 domain-containing protein [Eudoraea sp.]
MQDHQNQLTKLTEKLDSLLQRQDAFSKEIEDLKKAILALKAASEIQESTPEPIPEQQEKVVAEAEKPSPKIEDDPTPKPAGANDKSKFYRDSKDKILGGVCSGFANYVGMNVLLVRFIWLLLSILFCIGILIYLVLWMVIPNSYNQVGASPIVTEVTPQEPVKTPDHSETIPPKKEPLQHEPVPTKRVPFDLEKYIGENLISKIGIGILVIGVAIGAKYSIDNNLISPLVRIILGYLVGISLLGIGLKLKKNYKNFSAILVSGAMAIMYFITFAAYVFYEMMPQALAFVLMVLFTITTVMAALNYNKQVIAHIGLVGAYCIPFLLSEGKGEAIVLLSYMAIINIGILFIAFKKYWKPLYLAAFFITWFIFAVWYFSSYEMDVHFVMTLLFLLVFFVTFYLTFLAYKIFKNEAFELLDIFMVLSNAFIFYGLGYTILDNHPDWASYLGVFTLFNALLHLLVSFIIYRQKLADKNIFYLVSGLVLVFVTITIPVQLDGNWVTLLWACEATLLFWIGRTKGVPVYEKLSYPLLLLSFFSLTQDWNQAYININYVGEFSNGFVPFLNSTFLTSLLCVALVGFINFLHYSKKYTRPWPAQKDLFHLISYGISGIFLVVLYGTFATEISNYWDQLLISTSVYNSDLKIFKAIWLLNYSLLFMTALSFVNIIRLKNSRLAIVSITLNILVLFAFLTVGLYGLSELRESYLGEGQLVPNETGFYNISIRYISFLFIAMLLYVSYKHIKQAYVSVAAKIPFDLILCIALCWIASSELIHWLDISGASNSYKLGLSILWGLFAVILVSIGIWKKKKHLRVGAIVLFSITLIKLFFYDISHLNTISKTIVFISLGILLLIVSFLYTKFKDTISSEK